MSDRVSTNNFFESDEIAQRLLECSPDAVILISLQEPNPWSIAQCNESAWRMHGYENKEDFLEAADQIYAEHQNWSAIVAAVRERGIVMSQVQHRRKDGSEFPTHCNQTLIHIHKREYLLSIERDITEARQLQETRDRFQAIFDKSPDGIVIIEPLNGAEGPWIIEDCNKAFCEMNGYAAPTELIGKEIRDVSCETRFDQVPEENFNRLGTGSAKGNDKIRKEYYQRLKAGSIKKKEIHKRKDGTQFPIEASSNLIMLNGHERVLGIDRDITEEMHFRREQRRLRKVVEDLQHDVGRTFHTYSATLRQVSETLGFAIEALGPDLFAPGLSPLTDEVWASLVGSRNSLVSTLRNLIEIVGSDFQRQALSSQAWERLDSLQGKLSQVEALPIPEHRMPVLRSAAREVLGILARLETSRIPKESVRDVKRSAQQLERMACLFILRTAQDSILEVDYLVRDLRERVITEVTPDENSECIEFRELVNAAVAGLALYADYKGVELRLDDRCDQVQVFVIRRDIVRALNNLLQNAIKYSWWRDQHVQPWIAIRTYIKRDRVFVDIEDYGVPIPRDEIEQKLIFRLGYRGRLSGQRGRPGTGIGLADALEMARRYGGNVAITSRPAPTGYAADDLSVPHIKTATLYLPIYCTKKEG